MDIQTAIYVIISFILIWSWLGIYIVIVDVEKLYSVHDDIHDETKKSYIFKKYVKNGPAMLLFMYVARLYCNRNK